MPKLWTEISDGEMVNTVDLEESDFQFIRNFQLLYLTGNAEFKRDTGSMETGLLILEGVCRIAIDGGEETVVGERNNVFSGLPWAVYLPIDTAFSLKSDGAKICLCQTEAEKKTEPAVIDPKSVKVMQVGMDNWSREVRIIIGPESPSVNMVVGETLNPPGNWSGTPPHKHEGVEANNESRHEELYYFKTDKPQGWGLQRTYSPERGVDELIRVRENSITLVPWGYHQIASAPGYTLYYTFFLAGIGKALSPYEDPDHNWIKP